MSIRSGRGVTPPRPDRRVALPLVVLVPPPLFLLVRELSNCQTPLGCRALALAAYGCTALLAVGAAVVLADAASAGRMPDWVAPSPDDLTLACLAAIVGGLAAFVAASALGVVPVWLGRLLAPVGVLLAFPLAVAHAALIGSAMSLGPPPQSVRFGVTAVGIALSGAWWYALAKTVAHGLNRVNKPRD